MNGIELIANILKSEGIEWVACYPSNPLIEALAKIDIKVIAFRHERGALMAADGFSRTNDRQKFGVFVMQSAAGAENSMGALAQANADNIPVLVLPGGYTLDRMSVAPNFWASKMYEPVSKYAETIFKVEEIPSIMRRAFHHLRNGRPAPVVVEMPADVCAAQVPTELENSYSFPKQFTSKPTNDAIDAAVAAIQQSKNLLIWSGSGVLMSQATKELQELAELLSAPVYTTMPGKSSFDERHDLSLGAGSTTTTLAAKEFLLKSDTILALGSSLTKTPYSQIIPPGKTIIQNTNNPDSINKDESVDVALVGDTKETITELIIKLKGIYGESKMYDDNVRQEISQYKADMKKEFDPFLNSEEEPISPYRVVKAINETLDLENSIITHDAGAPREQSVAFINATVPHSYIGWGKTTHLGFGLPLIIGAKIANPDKFCLNIMGDGAFGMSGMDFETATRQKIGITTIIYNNGGMATYPVGASNDFPVAREKSGVGVMTGNYANFARAFGGHGIEVTKIAELAPALQKAQELNKEGITVIIDIQTSMVSKRGYRA
jgi:thiamine pyrophosphate-dependent acetolactate synthase large subunit-like protein